MAIRGLFVLVLVVAMVAGVTAGSRCIETFPLVGLKCKITNLPQAADLGVKCPEGNPSMVTFCKAGRTVTIVGNFAAPGLGVCDPNVNPYTLPANTVVKYEQYADQVFFRIPGRVSASFRCLLVSGKKVCVGTSEGVSYLTDCVPAGC
ncbi:hypothetical protein M758_11G032100 [Ceratodon purpureus]|nr:hypothetical protein M758_11G032100 [Ceratodon purpureus]